ncbi:RlpA-like double-psi beta-barrel-protein domain-containing protein-containing protein [Lineolata rhizophorae]|uniref:Cellulase n=1 Tax=Lineolata rhizophorae TaxID=578093 RepID=A0A6A6NTF4_9PEZI|nr:RlpA-like double-psi beta-barrel-protein domain-containing protein-containing protein [Lineolata rhizophorae]
MASALKKVALAALATGFFSVASAQSGTGQTTRYWDCCKGSCAWTGKASVTNVPMTCDMNDNPLSNPDAASACDATRPDGEAYMCTAQSPWAVDDDLSYGFAAVRIAGGNEASWCCACYELTFTSTSIQGKKMVVQATNTGGDLGSNHFDLAIPGGGVGQFNACTNQWGAPPQGWGAQYGGISSRSECDGFPDELKPGCYWRFDWFEGADNPSVSFQQVSCPTEITDITGCRRNDDPA